MKLSRVNFPASLALVAVCLTACASGSQAPRGDGSPPWSSLTSPSAALKVVVDEVCLPAIIENRPIGELAEARYLWPVPPASTGSPSATAAWRLGSWHRIYVMQLPNGGCSASVDAGDADDLAAATVAMAQARAPLARGLTLSARDGEAENVAWCTPEADRPLVVGVLRKLSGSGPALVVNVFRAQGARPSFCAP